MQRRVWYKKYDELVDFWTQHGHFGIVERENQSLFDWVALQRKRFKGDAVDAKPLLKMQLYLLDRIEFTWVSNRHILEWQLVYDEVVQFLDVHGHFPSRLENAKLRNWIGEQKKRYRGHGTCRNNKSSC